VHHGSDGPFGMSHAVENPTLEPAERRIGGVEPKMAPLFDQNPDGAAQQLHGEGIWAHA